MSPLARSACITAALLSCTTPAATALLEAQTPYSQEQEQRFHEEATAALAHGQYEEAAVLAATRADDDPSAVALQARLLVLRGELTQADALLEAVAAQSPSSGAGLEYGLLLIQTGRMGDAGVYLQALINAGSRSRSALALYRAGLAARALGRHRDANTLLRGAALASPGDPAMQTAWAELFLEKYNQPDAQQSFQEALKLDEKWAPALLGLARTLVNENPPAARSAADRALEIDPTYVGAHLFVAELEMGDQNMDAARAALERALEINPKSLEALAMSAAMAYVQDRQSDFEVEVARTLEINPTFGDVYRVAGSHTARAYRFDEAVQLVERALELDPSNTRAYAELGMHLLRTGDEPAARVALERAFEDDPFDISTFNLLNLLDTLDEFETFERGDLIVRLHPEEAPVLSEYILTLAQEALDELSAKYAMTVEGPILVEMFPTHDDFAVRTLGLPGFLGALGACFGRVVTLDSPRAVPPGRLNWRSTLWHEIAHVITLQMSDNRLPRWLSEGISTYEEKEKRLEWGRDEVLAFARALNDDAIPPLQDLNAGFSQPDRISMSYFHASVLVEHLVEAYGHDALRTLVRAYADGLDTEEGLARINLDFDSLQASFDLAIDEEFGALQRALRPPENTVTAEDPAERLEALRTLAEDHPDSYSIQFSLGAALRSAGELRSALEAFERASALAPQATGIESPRGRLASVAQELGDRERAMLALERLLEYDETSIEAVRELVALAEETGDEARLALAYDRLIGIDPFDPVAHQAIGRRAMIEGDTATAILEFEVALAVGSVDRVSVHTDLAEGYLRVGDFAGAKRETLRALELAPTYERAQELLLRVIEEQP